MCGIVGYCGYRNAKNIVLEGLKTLEYRGYDSAGIALCGKELSVYKSIGRVSALEDKVPEICSLSGIGHTRWATHGKPTAENAHPHLSFDKSVAVVHNGVIENCEQLKRAISERGITFCSTTDSEIIAHLLALDTSGDMLSAVENVASMLEGAATFLALKKGDDKIYCHRRGASLSIGIGNGENFVASDTLAIAKYTQEMIVLKDGETAVMSPSSVKFYKDRKNIAKSSVSVSRAAPRECSCFMRSEIDEIPDALERTYESFLAFANDAVLKDIRRAERIFITGCGTAYHSGLYGKEVFETFCSLPAETVIASEFDNARFADDKSFVILISQSGETADTLNALKLSKAKGAKTLAVTNVKASALALGADYTMYLDAGAEIAVAATKSYNCQLLALYLLAKKTAGVSVSLSEIRTLAKRTEEISSADLYEDKFKNSQIFFIGKGKDGISAKEGALKFKEITYKMTDAYPAGELKHGAIALIDENCAVIAVVTDPKYKHHIETALNELRSRGAYTVALSAVGDVGADKTLSLPYLDDPFLYPVLSAVPLQNLALGTSLCLGLNPDKPRNLAKSVTVI